MLMKFLLALPLLALPTIVHAADITGVPKIREGDQITIGSSRIRLAGLAEAQLIDRWRINAAEPDAGTADGDLVAFPDLWNPGDIGSLRHRRQQQDRKREQEFHRHAKRRWQRESVISGKNITGELWCGSGRRASTGGKVGCQLNARRELS